MKAFNFYLNFKGNTEEAFNFYKSVFGGDFVGLQRFRGMPGTENIPPADLDKIMHIALPLGKSNMLMGTDAMESMEHKIVIGTNFHIVIDAESRAEADKLFNALSPGGKVSMPMSVAPWGDYFGMLTDRFDTQWMISYAERK